MDPITLTCRTSLLIRNERKKENKYYSFKRSQLTMFKRIRKTLLNGKVLALALYHGSCSCVFLVLFISVVPL